LGEIAIRAYVHRRRGGVPVVTTAVVNLWERLLDASALALIAAVMALGSGNGGVGSVVLLVAVAATMTMTVRRFCLRAATTVVRAIARPAGQDGRPAVDRLTEGHTWRWAFATSVAAWLLPGLAFWGIASVWGPPFGFARAEEAYASSALAGGIVLAPGGIV